MLIRLVNFRLNPFLGSLLLYCLLSSVAVGLPSQTSKSAFIDFDSTVINQLDSLETEFNILLTKNIPLDVKLHHLDSFGQIIMRATDSLSLHIALVLHYKGRVNYRKGREGYGESYLNAIEYYQRAIEIRNIHREEYPAIAELGVMKSYGNIAGSYLNLNIPDLALVNLRQALSMANKYHHQDVTGMILMWNTLAARASLRIGDYDNALTHFADVIYLAEKDLTKLEWKWRALIETGGMQAINLNQPEIAISNLLEGVKGLTNQEKPNINLLAGAYNNLGIAYRKTGIYNKSKYYYQKSVALNDEYNRTLELAKNYTNLGVLYNSMGNPDSAEIFSLDAMALFDSLEYIAGTPAVLDNLGDLEQTKGNQAKSITYDNQALKRLIPGFNPSSIYNNPDLSTELIDKQAILISLGSKANSLLELYLKEGGVKSLKSAYHTYMLADIVIGQIRTEFFPDASKISLAVQTKSIYEKALDTCWELYQLFPSDTLLDRAFEFSEKSRAVVLLDAIRKTRANEKVAKDLIEQEKEINIKVNFYEKQVALLNQQHNESPVINIYDSLLFYRENHTEILDAIKNSNQVYYDVIYDQKTALPTEIQKLLTSDQALIEYFVGSSNAYTFFIAKYQKLFLKISSSDSLKRHTNQLVNSIPELDQSFIAPSYKVYQALMHTIEEESTLPPHLIIIPDDVLNLINFETLVTKKPNSNRIYFPEFQDYMIFQHQISYSFSATSMIEFNISGQGANQELLALAPTFKEGFSIQGSFFDKLDWNIDEVEQIGSLYPNKSLLGNEVNKDNFMSLAPDYGIIHFATHAKADDEYGDLSFIAFGPNQSDLFYAKDLYALDINANVVVLSACQTSIGPLSRGEGIISLARGFIYAGASSVVTSLWNVRERSNKTIILDFYQGLKAGESKDGALRQAKLKFLESITTENQELAHPYFWAPMIHIGNTDPFRGGKNFRWMLIIGVMILSGFIFVLIRKKIFPANNIS